MIGGQVSGSGDDQSSFAALFGSLDDSVSELKEGRVVKGTITSISKELVTVDIGFKCDGVARYAEFVDAEAKLLFKVGDEVEVYIVALENDLGQLILSRERAEQWRVWKTVEDAFAKGTQVQGKVVHKVKGGLQVDIGIPAFLPGSQVDLRPHRNLEKFIGQIFDFKILKITKEKGNIVLSRRAVLSEARDELRTETLKVLSEGVVMEGIVKNITDYGAFIDLGGVDGLLHITDISWGRVGHPSEKLSVGQKIPVVIIKYDQDKQRVSLGMKQLKEDPWGSVSSKYPVGSRVQGKILNVAEYGVFVEIEEGIEGLVHISEMGWNKKVRNPSKLVSVGDQVDAVVLGIDAGERKIALSMKQLQPNPWEDLKRRYPVGTKVKGKIRTIADFGIFIGIEEGIDGLVHISDFSWTKKITDPKEIHEIYKKGDEVEAIILGIDVDGERLSLGVKQLSQDPWDTIPQRYPIGSRIKGKITSVREFGVFVEIEDGIEGLIHSTQLGVDKGQDPKEIFKAGEEVESEITAIDKEERKISLSIKAIKKREEREVMSEFGQDSDVSVRLGDFIGGHLEGDEK